MQKEVECLAVDLVVVTVRGVVQEGEGEHARSEGVVEVSAEARGNTKEEVAAIEGMYVMIL